MFWLVQENLLNHDDYSELCGMLERYEVPHASVSIVPLSQGLSLAERIIGLPADMPRQCFVFGSTTMAMIAKEYDWEPGAFLNDNFDARVWIPAYGSHALNPDAGTYRLADVPERRSPFFVRPVLDTKSFVGGVYETWEPFAAWREKVIGLKGTSFVLDADTLVSVAAWAKIIDEYRHFVVDGRVVTSSRYKRNGKLDAAALVDSDVIEFASQMVALWKPDRAFVIDTARVMNDEGGIEHKVVEINNINSSGLYKCDISKFVQAIDAMEFPAQGIEAEGGDAASGSVHESPVP